MKCNSQCYKFGVDPNNGEGFCVHNGRMRKEHISLGDTCLHPKAAVDFDYSLAIQHDFSRLQQQWPTRLIDRGLREIRVPYDNPENLYKIFDGIYDARWEYQRMRYFEQLEDWLLPVKE